MPRIRIKYDKHWKAVVTHLFDRFVAFFLPDLNNEIDWTIAPEFLEKELHKLLNVPKSKRIVDKLVKVQLKTGEEKWLLIHIEFQTDGSVKILFRMYEYEQLIRERFNKDVVAIVIYTGDRVPKQRDTYHRARFGTSLTYQFNTYAVIEQDEAALLAHPNPFALVVLANLYVLRSKEDEALRYGLKKKLYELAKSRGFDLHELIRLTNFVVELMQMSPELETQFDEQVIQPKTRKDTDMEKLSPYEKRFINNVVENMYGETAEAMVAEIKSAKNETKAAKSETKAAQSETKAAQAKAILLLYTKAAMSVEAIAEDMQLTKAQVRKVLRENKLIE